MPESIAELLISGITGGAIGGWLVKLVAQRLLEDQRTRNQRALANVKASLSGALARESSAAAEFRAAAKDLTRNLAVCSHSMCWLTWLAHTSPDEVTDERTHLYDDEMHRLLPELSAGLVHLAALDAPSFRKLNPKVKELFSLDIRIGEAAVRLRAAGADPGARMKAIEPLAALYGEVKTFEGTLAADIQGIIVKRVEERAKATPVVRLEA